MKNYLNKKLISDIFFDLDHTLWDFNENSRHAFSKIFKIKKIDLELENFIKLYNTVNQKYWKLYRENLISHQYLRIKRLEESFHLSGINLNSTDLDEINNLYIRLLTSFNHLIPGTLSLIKFLKRNYRLSIITNGFEDIQQKKINNSGLKNYFDQIVTADKVGYKKPNPKIFKKALKKNNLDSSNCLMIGDTFEADILGALKINMQAIHFNSNNEKKLKLCPIVYRLIDIKRLFCD